MTSENSRLPPKDGIQSVSAARKTPELDVLRDKLRQTELQIKSNISDKASFSQDGDDPKVRTDPKFKFLAERIEEVSLLEKAQGRRDQETPQRETREGPQSKPEPSRRIRHRKEVLLYR